MEKMQDDHSVTGIILPKLTLSEQDDVMKLAAVGLLPADIALSMEWSREKRAAFCLQAMNPASEIAVLIASGRATGRAMPQQKLQEAAQAGNIDAIKTLEKFQKNNRFEELLTKLDDDELFC